MVHGLVYYTDGSVLAQLGSPDMRTPIANALGWPRPHRRAQPAPRPGASSAQLTFEAPDPMRFPALRLARAALDGGGGAPTVLNAANEVAVAAFLDGRIGFLDIAAIVERDARARCPTGASIGSTMSTTPIARRALRPRAHRQQAARTAS